MRGPITKSFGKLIELRKLELVGSYLTGKISLELADAKGLTTILLSKNKLIGAIPEKVLNLKKLQNNLNHYNQ